MGKKNSVNYVKMVVIIAIGAALYGLGGLIGIPIFANTTLKPAMAILAMFAAIWGPVVGFLVGFLGHMLTDTFAGWGVWVTWALGSGLVGLMIGFFGKFTNHRLQEGSFAGKDIGILIAVSFVANFVGYLVSALLDCALYSEPANKVFMQQLLTSIPNTIMIATIGVLLIVLYAKKIASSKNLKMED